MTITVRAATADDAMRLAELCSTFGYQASASQIAERLATALASGHEAVWVAADRSQVLGWLQVGRNLSIESTPHAEIRGLVVDPGWRGQGIGRQLVSAAMAWTRAAGLDTLRVRSRSERQAAHNFYRGLGFAESKQQSVFDLAVGP
jgi:ribosomal protein S18 acetylase RimI-like enzyme